MVPGGICICWMVVVEGWGRDGTGWVGMRAKQVIYTGRQV
mgnify:CR=1 FL=1